MLRLFSHGENTILAFMLYRFSVELSDVDRGLYTSLDFRAAQHPSEIPAYLLTRALAYALSYQDGLEFAAGGLSDPEAPALRAIGHHGATELWIEIGNPSAKKLHKACKTARVVQVYTYKSAQVLIDDIKNNQVHRAGEIEIYSIEMKFLEALEKQLTKNNRWTLLVQQGRLDLSTGSQSFSTEVQKLSVSSNQS